MRFLRSSLRVRGQLAISPMKGLARYWLPLLLRPRLRILLRRHLQSGVHQVVTVVGPTGNSAFFWDYFLSAFDGCPRLPWVALPVWEPGISSRWWHLSAEFPAGIAGWLLRSGFRREVRGPDTDTLMLLSRTAGPVHIPASVYYGSNLGFVWSAELCSRMVVWDDALWDGEFVIPSEGLSSEVPEPAFWVSSRRVSDVAWIRVRAGRGVRNATEKLQVLPLALSHTVFGIALPASGFGISQPMRVLPWWVRMAGFISLWVGFLWMGLDLLLFAKRWFF